MPLKFGPFCDVVAGPVSVNVTCAVDGQVPVAVVVQVAGGTYCALIVQVFPGPGLGLRTVPEAQVPPVIEKAPVPAVLVMVGAAVRVNGLAAAPLAVLVTVTRPFFVVGVAGAGFNAGVGPAKPTVAPVTVNVTALLAPAGVVTLRFRIPGAAAEPMVNVALTWVSETDVKLLTVTMAPKPLIAVAPVRPTPVRVTGTLLPRTPELGAIPVRNGPTVNGTVLEAGPVGNPTARFLTPRVAVVAMLSRAVILVEEFTTKLPAASVTPPPSPCSPVAPVRFVPTRFTTTPVAPVLPRTPWFGVIEASVAGATVKHAVQVAVPPGVVTLTSCAAAVAVPAIVKVVVTAVGLRLVMTPAETPAPCTTTVVAALRLVPVMMTATAVPGLPVEGLTDVTVGAIVVPAPGVSIAPMSKNPEASGRGLPKKSVEGCGRDAGTQSIAGEPAARA